MVSTSRASVTVHDLVRDEYFSRKIDCLRAGGSAAGARATYRRLIDRKDVGRREPQRHVLPHLAVVVLLLDVAVGLDTTAPPAEPAQSRPDRPRRHDARPVVVPTRSCASAAADLPVAFTLARLALLVRLLLGVSDVAVHAVEVLAGQGERPPPFVGRVACSRSSALALQRRRRMCLRWRRDAHVDDFMCRGRGAGRRRGGRRTRDERSRGGACVAPSCGGRRRGRVGWLADVGYTGGSRVGRAGG